MRLEVGVFRDCQYFTSYGVTSDAKAPGGVKTLGPVRSHADLIACGFPKREAEGIRRLINTANDLCGYLLRGKSVAKWCKDKKLWLASVEVKKATGRTAVGIIGMRRQVVVW
jgi:hypothetical protein